jgi:DNA-directed RNA polymerase
MWAHPAWSPSPIKPKPWIDFRDGGYGDKRAQPSTTFVRHHGDKEIEQAVSAAFKDGSIKSHADGVNSLMAVPWKINEPVLAAVKHLPEEYARLRRWTRRSKKAGRLLSPATWTPLIGW